MRNKVILLFGVLFVFLWNSLSAQQTTQPEPLLEVLSSLQERFQVQFNYASEIVDGVRVPVPDDSLDLSAAVAFLKESTG
ncbi:MAG: hypothetical protein HKN67_01940, partial [Saprospiraceae bacterium]|nr:hypothetical protein [Saprospiraceae bacterium]